MVEFVIAVEIGHRVKYTVETTTRGYWPLSLDYVGWSFFDWFCNWVWRFEKSDFCFGLNVGVCVLVLR